jgi:hypothetical protein
VTQPGRGRLGPDELERKFLQAWIVTANERCLDVRRELGQPLAQSLGAGEIEPRV